MRKAMGRIWRGLKRSRVLGLGPVGLHFHFRRRVPHPTWWPTWDGPRAVRLVGGDVGAADGHPAMRLRDSADAHDPRCAPAVGQAPAPATAPQTGPQAPTVQAPGVALLVGVGPGLGHALVAVMQEAGFEVVAVARDGRRLAQALAPLCRPDRPAVQVRAADATQELSVQRLMAELAAEQRAPALVVYTVQGFGPGRALDVEVCAFEDNWRQNCLGAFIVAREAGRAMRARGAGSIVLVGSTSGLLGREDHLNLAVGKFGLRALAQVMARELWPDGVHVVHCVVDADIREPGHESSTWPQALPEDLARMVLALHQQPRSCWTSEVDFRPWNERFWQHC